MDYIYNGELKIYQEDIDRFLEVGQRLGLEGLIGQTVSPKENTFDKESNAVQDIKHFDDKSYYVEVKSNENQRINKAITTKDKGYLSTTHDQTIISFAVGSSIDSVEELNKKVEESYSRDNDGRYLCLHCEKTFKNSGHIKEHVEVHFDGLLMNCNYCENTFTQNTFRSRNYLRQHVKKHRS